MADIPNPIVRRTGFFSGLPLFFKIWMVAVFTLAISGIIASVSAIIYVAMNPEGAGAFAGRIMHGFTSTM